MGIFMAFMYQSVNPRIVRQWEMNGLQVTHIPIGAICAYCCIRGIANECVQLNGFIYIHAGVLILTPGNQDTQSRFRVGELKHHRLTMTQYRLHREMPFGHIPRSLLGRGTGGRTAAGIPAVRWLNVNRMLHKGLWVRANALAQITNQIDRLRSVDSRLRIGQGSQLNAQYAEYAKADDQNGDQRIQQRDSVHRLGSFHGG